MLVPIVAATLATDDRRQTTDDIRQADTEAQEIAQEIAAFLGAQVDRPRAVKALRRAWAQALALARHDLDPGDQGNP
jgi:hypothetical protein